MASPFALFRKNQQTLLVLLFILAMFAFIFMDSMAQGQGLNLPMLGMLIGTAVLTMVGVKMKKPLQFAAAGAISGLLIGYVADMAGADPGGASVVSTNAGNLNEQEFSQLLQQRHLANQFIGQAVQTALGPSGAMFSQGYSFQLGARSTEEDIALGYILRKEAKKMGIFLDNNAISNYINQATNNKLSKEDYQNILRALNVTDAQLYTVLRDELTAKVVRAQMAPHSVMTPDKYWELYKKMQVSQYLNTVAVPVSAFTDSVKDPGEEKLKSFFDEYKNLYPVEDAPGFRQPRKVQVAYVEASFLGLEQQVGDITNEEIETYYEENKEILYLNRTVPDDDLKMDSGLDPFDTSLDDVAPKLVEPQTNPEEKSPEKGEDDTSVPDPDSKPEPKAEESKNTKPEEENKEPSKNDENPESSQLSKKPTLQTVVFLAQDEEPDKESAEKPKPSSEEESDKQATEKPVDPNAPLKAEKPDSENSVPPAPEPPPKYRPLDELLRSEIEDQLLRQRTRELQSKLSNEAYELMYSLSNEYYQLESSEKKKAFIKDARNQVRELAEKLGLNYEESKLMDYLELSESDDFPIGSAYVGEGPIGQNPTTVAEKLFQTSPDLVYEVDKARSLEPNSVYVFWKTADIEENVPKFEDEGIREQVLEAWRLQEARPLAKTRAEELLDRLKKTDQNWEDFLAEETITGEEEGLILRVLPSERFSWMRTRSVPGQFGMTMQVPEPSTISSIDNADEDFMRTIFFEMENEDLQVVPNGDKSIYYVVQVKGREPASESEWEVQRKAFMQTELFSNMFMPSPYSQMSQQVQTEVYLKWLEDLTKHYDLSITLADPS